MGKLTTILSRSKDAEDDEDEVNTMATEGTFVPPSGSFYVDQMPQMEIMHLQGELNRANHQINRLEQHIDDNANNAEARIASVANVLEKLTNVVSDIEKDKIAQFKSNDVYEVNKRIERLEAKVALINSNLVNSRIVRFFFKRLWQT